MGTKKTRGKKPGSPSGASKSSLKAIHISKYGHRNITYQIDHGESWGTTPGNQAEAL
jgi:hypothetical protein